MLLALLVYFKNCNVHFLHFPFSELVGKRCQSQSIWKHFSQQEPEVQLHPSVMTLGLSRAHSFYRRAGGFLDTCWKHLKRQLHAGKGAQG